MGETGHTKPLRRCDWTEQAVETLRRLVGEGLTLRQIGERFGVSRSAVAGKIDRLGLAPARQRVFAPTANAGARWTPERDARLRALAAEGHATAAIAADLGVSDAAARHRAALLGLTLRRIRPPVVKRGVKLVVARVSAPADKPAGPPESANRAPTGLIDLQRGQCRFPLWAEGAPFEAQMF